MVGTVPDKSLFDQANTSAILNLTLLCMMRLTVGTYVFIVSHSPAESNPYEAAFKFILLLGVSDWEI